MQIHLFQNHFFPLIKYFFTGHVKCKILNLCDPNVFQEEHDYLSLVQIVYITQIHSRLIPTFGIHNDALISQLI